jgi:hypothetical protein
MGLGSPLNWICVTPTLAAPGWPHLYLPLPAGPMRVLKGTPASGIIYTDPFLCFRAISIRTTWFQGSKQSFPCFSRTNRSLVLISFVTQWLQNECVQSPFNFSVIRFLHKSA